MAHQMSCMHIPVPQDLATEVADWSMHNIPPGDIYYDPAEPGYVLEEAHITLLYGIHADVPDGIAALLSGVGEVHYTLGDVAVFRNMKYDVVKINIHGEPLYALNRRLQAVPNANPYPVYMPHITIAYVQKGKGSRLEGRQDFKGRRYVADHAVFSSSSGRKAVLPIKA